jgi:hypothetical protein
VNVRTYSPDARRVAAAMRRRPQETRQALKGALLRSTLYLEGQTAQRVPVDTARSRNAITSRIIDTPQRLAGIVEAAPLVHMPALEFGRRPGRMPPPQALEGWVRRKMGVSGRDVRRVAFLVARRIGRRGTKGAHMFERGFKASVPYIRRSFRTALDSVRTR